MAKLSQIAWVVPDIKAAEKFFREVMGVPEFGKSIINVKQYHGTYYGKPADDSSHTYMTYSGGTFIELIQPISGESIFKDWLEKNPKGGMQHVAFSVPIAEFDKAAEEMSKQGYTIMSTYDTPIAKIYIFDTYAAIGVATELMGITEEGVTVIEKMKSGMNQ